MFPSIIIQNALQPFLVDDVINIVLDLYFGYKSKADYKDWYSKRVLMPMLAGFAPGTGLRHAMLDSLPVYAKMQAKARVRKRKRELIAADDKWRGKCRKTIPEHFNVCSFWAD